MVLGEFEMANTDAENINENVDAELTEEINTEETAEAETADNTEETAENEASAENNEGAEESETPSDSGESAEETAESEAPAENSEGAEETLAPQDDSEAQESGDAQPKKMAAVFGKIAGVLKSKKFVIPVCSVLGAAVVAYIGGVVFYGGHFLPGTRIGTFDCSNMTVAEVKEKIQNEIDNYGFTFYEKDDKQETIMGSEIGLSVTPIGELEPLKERQNPWSWFFADKKAKKLPLDIEVSYNEDALYNRITEMDFMAAAREGAEGKAQNIKFEDGVYTVTDDGAENIISLNGLFNRVKPKINELYKGMSLEKEGCYGGLENDDTMKGVLNLLNKCIESKITYTNSSNPKTIDGATIKDWLSVGDDYSVNFDADKVAAYVDELSKEYNTVGKERTFKTTGGSEITVSGGNYGWIVNKKKETEELLSNIKSGETVEREPIYSQKAASHNANDIADTYVEVSLGSQHMWYYKNGNVVVSSDVVTGNPYRGNGTPSGVYRLAYKARNAVLRGPGYESPVSYWMPFNGGIGLHDAPWRGAFGGSIFRGGGSHGCVNLPYSAAQNLFANVSEGDPVVVY